MYTYMDVYNIYIYTCICIQMVISQAYIFSAQANWRLGGGAARGSWEQCTVETFAEPRSDRRAAYVSV